MKPEHRSALLALAARRGQKGFSYVLEEALDQYLNGERERDSRRQEILSLAGVLTAEEANELRESARLLRETWR
jgi:hypothetical protein